MEQAPVTKKDDRIAELEKRVADLEAKLQEWRPPAVISVGERLDVQAMMRDSVNDLRAYSESADWVGVTEWRNPYGYL